MVNAPECMNESPTCTASDTELTQPCSGPVLYELVDKDGNPVGHTSATPEMLVDIAGSLWPDQHQDNSPTEDPNGWDIQRVMDAVQPVGARS